MRHISVSFKCIVKVYLFETWVHFNMTLCKEDLSQFMWYVFVMTNYVLDGYDLSALFDFSSSPISFSENPRQYVPNRGSIIYSVWDKDEKFIYIGISGKQKDVKKREPLTRMIKHASGSRSGDQFCVYVQDFHVIPKLVKEGEYTPQKGLLDRLTKEYIHKNLSYRFIPFNTDDSHLIVQMLERKIQSGELGLVPSLNGTASPQN